MWHYLALLLAVVIGLLIIAIIWHVRNLVTVKEIYSMIPLKRYLLSQEFKNIKAGDIIYTRSSIAAFQELIIPYIYKHVAIIVEFNGKLYIAETSGKGIIGRSKNKLIKRKGGVDIYPIKERLKNAIGPVFLSKLNKPLTEKKNDKLQDTTIDHLGEPYPNLISLYMLFILRFSIKTTMYCHTFVYTCLVNMGLISSEKRSATEIGKIITTIYEHQLNDGYLYEQPRQLIYDYDCKEELF